MTPLDFLLILLATWRVTYMVVYEAGPFNVFMRLRERTTLGGLLSCAYCASVWAGAGMLALYMTTLWPVVVALAASGGAIMLASYTGAEYSRQ